MCGRLHKFIWSLLNCWWVGVNNGEGVKSGCGMSKMGVVWSGTKVSKSENVSGSCSSWVGVAGMFVLDSILKHIGRESIITAKMFLHVDERHIHWQFMEEGVITCYLSALVGELVSQNKIFFASFCCIFSEKNFWSRETVFFVVYLKIKIQS